MLPYKPIHCFKHGTIHAFGAGPLQNLQYFIVDSASNQVAWVDPAWSVSSGLAYIAKHNWHLSHVLITHTHHDHINGVDELLAACTDAVVYISAKERDFYQVEFCGKAHGFLPGDSIRLGQTRIDMMLVPGHTQGSACYKVDHYLISGDSLFVFGCGHCRLRGGDPEALFESVQAFKNMPGHTICLPGHHYAEELWTTIDKQHAGNPFWHCQTREDFVWYRTFGHQRTLPYTSVSFQEMSSILKNRKVHC